MVEGEGNDSFGGAGRLKHTLCRYCADVRLVGKVGDFGTGCGELDLMRVSRNSCCEGVRSSFLAGKTSCVRSIAIPSFLSLLFGR